MNPFIYNIPTRIYFGENQLEHLIPELRSYGTKLLLVYGGGSIQRSGLYEQVTQALTAGGMQWSECSGVEPNPRVTSVQQGGNLCKQEGLEMVLAVGGGSVIDAAKFMAASACYDGDAWDLVTRKAEIKAALPVFSILTLSATGSEMNDGGVISNLDTQDKIGCSNPLLFPKASFLDPSNTFSVSAYQTACGSSDILSHVIEVYFNLNEDLTLLDGFMESIMKTVIRYAPVALAEPDNYEARANLMWASSLAINGLIDGGKQQAWTCHPMEHELSAYYDITHGHGLAILTPHWMEYTLNDATVEKYCQFATQVFGLAEGSDRYALARAGIEALAGFFFDTLGLARTLTELGIGEEDIPLMAKKACKRRTLKGFQPLDASDMEKIYRMCL